MSYRERRGLGVLLVILGHLCLCPVTWAGDVELPGHRAIEDLEFCDSHVFELAGETLAAEVYYSSYAVAFYVAAPELERPLLISPRGRSVQAVDAGRMKRGRGLRSRLAEDAVTEYLGQYREVPGAYVFELGGKTARLVERPPAIGGFSAGDLGKRHRRYGYQMREHVPRRRVDGKALTGQEGLLVRIYFGSWSRACELMVPKIMRLEEDLGGRVRFEYVGVAKGFTRDPAFREVGISSLPTAVVLRGGDEIGRLHGRPLDTPEDTLYELLLKAAQP